MRGMVQHMAPNLFEGSGPGCLHDACPEGKMTCGRPYKPDDVDGPAAARA
jgi:thymidylate synthase (FAD)